MEKCVFVNAIKITKVDLIVVNVSDSVFFYNLTIWKYYSKIKMTASKCN